jgi:hypothetical protein
VANILISHFSPVQDNNHFQAVCFFEGLANSLAEQGHNVLQIVSTRFISSAWNGANALMKDIDSEGLGSDIKKFNPDLCIFANNSVPETAYEVTNCPVILFLSDTVKFFNDKDVIKSNRYADRLYFYAPFESDIKEIKDYFGIDAERIIHMLPATALRAESLDIKQNISFIGSNFQNPKGLEDFIKEFPDRARLLQIMNKIHARGELISFLTNDEIEAIEKYMPISFFSSIFSPRDRLLVLAILAEQGLGLYGESNWPEVAKYFPDVAASFNSEKVYSLAHNQDIYNSSCISLSVSHSQSVDGFPWRVMDIMATNSCLLSDRKKGIEDFARGYVKLPLYDTPLEAYDLAKRLLKEESWRKDIVASSQQCILEKGMWKHRFLELGERVGVNLSASSPIPGKISYLYGEDYVVLYLNNTNMLDQVETPVPPKKNLFGKFFKNS